jgi:hypothetical protein
MTWTAITQEAYRIASAARAAAGGTCSLITPLIPDLGKVRTPRSIASRKFLGILDPLSKRFAQPWYFNDTGLTGGKYTERLYVQHISGAIFCLGTYFLSEWRIWGDPKDRPLVADFCAFVGIPPIAYNQAHIDRVFKDACIAHGLKP